MKRVKQINNIVIYYLDSYFIAKAPDGSVIYRSKTYAEIESWCKLNKKYRKNFELKLQKVHEFNVNNKTVLLHGSEHIVRNPVFGGGNSANDYGLGFYCVEERNIELAREWSCSIYNVSGVGYVNKYEIDTTGLKILNLNNFDIIYWVALTAQFRNISSSLDVVLQLWNNYHIELSKYDIIVGWRCDDTYSKIIKDFATGYITIEAVADAMKKGYLDNQVVLKSKKAFDRIKFIGAEKVDFSLYNKKFINRKDRADDAVEKCKRMFRQGHYIDYYLE